MQRLLRQTTAPHMKNTKIWFLRVEMRSTSKRMIWFTEAVLVLFPQTDGLLFIWKTIWVRCGWWCACAGYAVDRLLRLFAVAVCVRAYSRDAVDGSLLPGCYWRDRGAFVDFCACCLLYTKIKSPKTKVWVHKCERIESNKLTWRIVYRHLSMHRIASRTIYWRP